MNSSESWSFRAVISIKQKIKVRNSLLMQKRKDILDQKDSKYNDTMKRILILIFFSRFLEFQSSNRSYDIFYWANSIDLFKELEVFSEIAGIALMSNSSIVKIW